jgi:hypothetical protein
LRFLDTLPLAVPASFAVITIAVGVFLLAKWIRRPRSAQERERLRRIRVHVKGRMTEVTIHQADGNTLHYTYQIAGVAYSASQDVTTLLNTLSASPEFLIGPALAKYDPRNPANSIVACEHWLGVRKNALYIHKED